MKEDLPVLDELSFELHRALEPLVRKDCSEKELKHERFDEAELLRMAQPAQQPSRSCDSHVG